MSVLEARIASEAGGLTIDVAFHAGGGVTALFGPSGAGKTTILRCLAGLHAVRSGRIVLGGEALFDSATGVDLRPERRRIGFVFQDLQLFPHLSVEENLHYGRRCAAARSGAETASARGTPRVDPARAIEVLELGALLARTPADLSGGEARRVAIGRALLASPRLLLLDEPLAGLDEARKESALGLLEQVVREFQVPTIFVSHALSDILELTTRVAVIDGGVLLGVGELSDVLGTESVFRLANSLGLESLVEVEITGADPDGGLTRANLGGQELALPPVEKPPGTRALVALRPEDVILARAPVSGTSAQNALAGSVTGVHRLSDRVLVAVDAGGPRGMLRAEISARSARELGIEPGARVVLLVKAFSFRWRRFL